MAYYVNDSWAGKEAGTEVGKVGDLKYIIGENAFASVEEALKAVKAADSANIDALVDAYLADKEITLVEGMTKAGYFADNQDAILAWNADLETAKPVVEAVAVEILSKNTSFDADSIDADLLAYFKTRQEGVVFDADGKGKLEISIDLSRMQFSFKDFADVLVSGAAAKAGEFVAEDDKQTYYAAEEGAEPVMKTDKVAAVGKITVDKGAYVEEIDGYKTVTVTGNGTVVGSVEVKEYKNAYAEDGIWTNSEEKASGSVTVSDKANVGDIDGYKNVTVKEAEVGFVSNVGANLRYNEDKTDEIPDSNPEDEVDDSKPAEWTGKYEVTEAYNGNYNKVAVTNKIDWEKKSGSAKVVASYKANGAAKLEKAVAGSLAEFATVTAVDSEINNGIQLSEQYSDTYTTTIKDIKEAEGESDLIQLTDVSNEKTTRGGKVTLTNSMAGYVDTEGEGEDVVSEFIGANISGYNTVTLTNSSAGSISNGEYSLVKNTKNIYEVTADQIKKGNLGDAVYYEKTEKTGATGSVKVVVDKKATAGVEVGNISGYATVTLTGNGDKLVDAKYITGAETVTTKTLDSVVEDVVYKTVDGAQVIDYEKSSINGKYLYDEKSVAAGSVKLTDAKAKDVTDYKTVTLKNAEITSASAGDNGSLKIENIDKTATDGKVTETNKYNSSSSAAGSFAATDSYVGGEISGYATVKLTNTATAATADPDDTAGNITGTLKESFSTSYKGVYANYYAFKEGSDLTNKQLSSNQSYKESSAAMGSVTIKLDKDAEAPVKDDETGEYSYSYSYGNITNYANVNIAGTAAKGEAVANVVFVKNIIGANTTSNSSTDTVVDNFEVKNDKYNGEVNGKVTEKENRSVAGSVKLTDAVAEKVENYKTVTLKNAEIASAKIDSNFTDSETEEYKTNEGDVTYKATWTDKTTATGSFTAVDSQVTYGITGYKTVKLTNTSVGDVESVVDSSKKDTAEFTGSYNDWKVIEDGEEIVFGNGKTTSAVTTKATGSLTFALDKNAKDDAYSIGTIRNFATVKVSGWDKDGEADKFVTTGSITGALSVKSEGEVVYENGAVKSGKVDTEYKANGSVTLKDNVIVDGDISNFKKVSLTDTEVTGSVTGGEYTQTYDSSKVTEESNGWDTKDFVAGDLTMSDVQIGGDVSGFKKVSVKDEFNMIGSYTGTAKVDEKNLNAETIDIAKKATLVAGNIALDAEDKLVVNGELVFWGEAAPVETAEAGEGDAGEDETVKVLSGGKLEGKGKIYADSTTAAAIKADYTNANVVDLGATSMYFKGTAEELADNEAAIVWDGSEELVCGWVGKFEGDNTFSDDVDIIKFTWNGEAGTSQYFEIDFLGDVTTGFELTINEQSYKSYKDEYGDYIFSAKAGETYEIKVTRTEKGSTSYSIAAVMG